LSGNRIQFWKLISQSLLDIKRDTIYRSLGIAWKSYEKRDFSDVDADDAFNLARKGSAINKLEGLDGLIVSLYF
jgi:hypothetical protein